MRGASEAPSLPPQAANVVMLESSPGAPTMPPDDFITEARAQRDARPMMTPPSEVVEREVKGDGIGAWHNGKKITAMWSNSAVRNAYAAVAGLGWKKISNANDSSWLALTMMASHAEQTNATCNIRIESDGEIHEVYVW
jgi:hypothetical protein